jgi:hypothetical protein
MSGFDPGSGGGYPPDGGGFDPPPDPADPGPTAGPPDPEPITETHYVYEWQTAGDDQVCPICGPLDGSQYDDDDGPIPPLHINCRCVRVQVDSYQVVVGYASRPIDTNPPLTPDAGFDGHLDDILGRY